MLERLLLVLITIFGIIVLWLFFSTISIRDPNPIAIMIEVQLLSIMAIIGLSFICLKLWEQASEIKESLYQKIPARKKQYRRKKR